MEHRTVVGFLTEVPTHEGMGKDYFFEYEKSKYRKLIGFLDEVPKNIKIALCMYVEAINGFYEVCTHKPFFTEINT